MADAQFIKTVLSMRDIFARYGFAPNRTGFIACPFHAEKTASLGTFADGKRWKCFGCGAGGDVISFVQRLYDIGFSQAALRISEDFSLMGAAAVPKELPQELAAKQRAQREELASYRDEWTAHLHAFMTYDETLQGCRPLVLCEPMLPCYADALRWIDFEWAWLCEHAWR